MNQDDEDRHFWRTGWRWSANNRPARRSSRGAKLHGLEIFFVCIGFAVTLAGLILLR